jgi:phosphohistidine phosphatase
MKTLYLVRHAKSSWRHEDLGDSDRPLKPQGVHDAYEIAGHLAHKKIKPDFMVCSPANRAIHTGIIFAGLLGYPYNEIRIDKTLYNASKDILIDVIKKIDKEFSDVILFGHNPGLTELVCEYTKDANINIPTSGVACIQFDIEQWNEISEQVCKLTFIDFPKQHD